MEALENLFGKDFVKNKVSLVYYGIDNLICDSVPEPKKKDNDIIFISSLRFYKGVNILLYILSILKEKYNMMPQATIMGMGDNKFDLLQTAIMLGVNAKFVGGVSNIKKFDIIKNSKIMVQPHFDEQIGTAVCLEALYCKVPVVCWDLLINKERFGDTPRYLEKFDVMGAAEYVKDILENKKVQDLEGGKEFVAKNRTFTVTAKQINDILKEKVK